MRKLQAILIVLLAAVIGLTAVQYYVKRQKGKNTPPRISCPQEVLEISVKDQEGLLRDVTAADAEDGDLTDQIFVEHVTSLLDADTARVTYAVFDSAGSGTTCTRTVRYTDYRRPRFAVSEMLTCGVGETLDLDGKLTASDVLDGDVSNRIRLTALDIPASAAGVCHVTIQVTNSMQDTAALTLPVIVTDPVIRAPELRLTRALVYLESGARFEASGYLSSVRDPAKPSARIDGKNVEIDDPVDTAVPGVYYVTYRYTGAAADGIAVLTVVVE